MRVHMQPLSLARVGLREAVFHKPVEMIAHAALSRLIAHQAGNHAVLHHAAHAGHDMLLVRQHDVAGRRTHDHQHGTLLGQSRRRQRHMRVHIRRSHGNAGLQPHLLRHFLRQLARLASDGRDRAELLLHHVFQKRVAGLQKFLRRIAVPLVPDGLVARHAAVASFHARHAQNHPVAGLHVPIGLGVQRRILLGNLPELGEHPLGGNLAAVALQPFLSARLGDGIQPVRLILRRVVLPQLHIRMRIGWIFPAHRVARLVDGNHGAGGKIDADAHHVVFVNARVFHGLRHGGFQRLQIVVRVLKRPVRLQARAVGKSLVHHAVLVLIHRFAHLASRADFRHERARRKGSVVNADCVFPHLPSSSVTSGLSASPRSEYGTDNTWAEPISARAVCP